MDLFPWNDRFLTGIPSVDAERHRLVALVNEAAQRAGQVQDRAHLDRLYDALVANLHLHFSREERVMLEGGCLHDHCVRHRAEHVGLMEQVRLLRAADAGDSPQLLLAILQFLAGWLTHHILGMDREMIRQLEALKAGRHPEDVARETRAEDVFPTTLLLDGLGNVLRVLAQRSAALIDAHAQLAESNRLLEERVLSGTQVPGPAIEA